MDGEPEPTKPDDTNDTVGLHIHLSGVPTATLLCTEEWCVACGNCDFPESHKAQGLWKTEEVLDECWECEEETDEPMWCDECGIAPHCPDCWTMCGCDVGDIAYDAMRDMECDE